MRDEPGVAIVGCGRVGQKRARALGPARVKACADVEIGRARELADRARCGVAVADWREAVCREDVDIVIASAINAVLPEVAAGALENGKHVLVEKPAARSARELEPVAEAAVRTGGLARVGFNHRYHPALRQARRIVEEGGLGELMYVRGRYGHGGRPGYQNEWRADPRLSGGGELIDQGVHLLDLARWFLGDFSEVSGFAHTYFWPMPVEDNGFLLLRTKQGQAAFLHASCTEWKNLFSFEVFGRSGKLHAEGLGGSYGVERLSFYRMSAAMGPPETTIWEYPGEDDSWGVEFLEFLEDIRLGRQPSPGIADAAAALSIVERVPRS